MKTPSPPTELQSWFDYAVATMDVRRAQLDRIFDENDLPTYDDKRAAALEELDYLRLKDALPWVGMLKNLQTALSKKLGRFTKDIVENNLLATDFSNGSVRVQFEDGTDLMFQHAFYVSATRSEEGIYRAAVFTRDCGYHEFWIGASDRILECVSV